MPPDPLPPAELLLTDPTDRQIVHGRIVCPGMLFVGRVPTAHIVLPENDRQASHTHFHIELHPKYCRLTNTSKRGTLVNGLLIDAQCDLRHGDLIRAGESVFVVQLLRQGQPLEMAMAPTVIWKRLGDTTHPTEDGAATVGTAAVPEPLLTQLQLPGYRLVRRIGSGSMGMVWLAEDRSGQEVACKLVRPDLALNPETCERFRRETKSLRDLTHRHIVGFRDSGSIQDILFLVMDYVDGPNLAELLKQQGPFAVGRAVRLVCQVLEALRAAHNSGVVHRDVKPSNILVQNGSDGEEIRLADFGMAKAYKSAEISVELTLPGTAGGTLAYAAPEMVTDFRQAGPLADQYGAAATLYHLLSGFPLHDSVNPLEFIDCIRNRDPIPLSVRRPGLPAELCNAVHRALKREAWLRFPTVGYFHEALVPFTA